MECLQISRALVALSALLKGTRRHLVSVKLFGFTWFVVGVLFEWFKTLCIVMVSVLVSFVPTIVFLPSGHFCTSRSAWKWSTLSRIYSSRPRSKNLLLPSLKGPGSLLFYRWLNISFRWFEKRRCPDSSILWLNYSLHTLLPVSLIVRTVLHRWLPAGYTDICMSTRWQEISTLLLASMYLHDCKNTDLRDTRFLHLFQTYYLHLILFYQRVTSDYFWSHTGPSHIPEVMPI